MFFLPLSQIFNIHSLTCSSDFCLHKLENIMPFFWSLVHLLMDHTLYLTLQDLLVLLSSYRSINKEEYLK